MRRILCLILMLILPVSCAAEGQDVWMYAVSAGKADAILLSADGETCLIDTGYARSRNRILYAMRRMGVDHLAAVIVTHTDRDHVEGLTWLAESDISIDAWYASAMYTGVKEKKHPAVQAAEARGETVTWLQAGDSIALGSAVLNVLAPSRLDEDKENNNSLVMMLSSDQGSILLCGDMELPEEAILLASGANLSCDVLKVANHADDDTASDALLLAASPKIAVISTDSAEKPETPDARILRTLNAMNVSTCVTQECTGGILVRLSGGEVSAEKIDLPEASENVILSDLDSDDDRIFITNQGQAIADLSDWTIYSDRGGELYIFPSGTILPAGETIIVGTKSSEGDYDLKWNDKKVIHKSKSDNIILYDANGAKVSSLSNGK